MKKVQKALVAALCLAIGTCALTACGGDDKPAGGGDKYKVTFYDGTTSLSVVDVDKDGTVTPPATAPTKEGYEFVRWCATPTYSQVFDFSKPITEDTRVYAGYRSTQADNHTWYLAGASNVSDLFAESGNYKEFKGEEAENLPDTVTFTKDANKGNRFTFTADFYQLDKFQILNTVDGWGPNQIGYGYIDPAQYSTETTAMMYFGGGLSGINKTADVIVGQDGNYTLTLDIDADGKLTEFSYKRNGDAAEVEVSYTDFYIKGASITSWDDMYNDATRMSRKGDVYTMEVYLQEGDQFMFTSVVTNETGTKPGSLYIKADVLDDASKEYVGGTTSNISAKATGTYKFTYNATTNVLSVTFDATKTPAQYDYYLDGAFGDAKWGDYQKRPDDYKLTYADGKYTISSVELAADDQIVIVAHDKDEAELTWDNMVTKYNFEYLKPNTSAFVAADPDNKNYNIKVATAGVYDITFDSYARMISIKIHNDSPDVFDIYLKGLGVTNAAGTESTWDHNFADGWRFTINEDNTAYELTVTVAAEASFGLAKYDKGATSGNGDFINASAIGTAGDANATFGTANNFTCATAGEYKIVYTIATGAVDFYAVTA